MDKDFNDKIADLKNNILAVQDKLNNLTILINSLKSNGEKLNEIINIVHNLNFERSNQNKTLFETICPDLVRRITEIEKVLRESTTLKRKK